MTENTSIKSIRLPPNPSSTLLSPSVKAAHPSMDNQGMNDGDNIPIFDDSLSCQTMNLLLQQPATSPSTTSFMEQTTRHSLRRNLLQLQKSIDNDMHDLKSLCSSLSANNKTAAGVKHHSSRDTSSLDTHHSLDNSKDSYPSSLSAQLHNGHMMLDKAMKNLAAIHKSSQYAATSLAAEIILDVWQTHCNSSRCELQVAVEHVTSRAKKDRCALEAKVLALESRIKELESISLQEFNAKQSKTITRDGDTALSVPHQSPYDASASTTGGDVHAKQATQSPSEATTQHGVSNGGNEKSDLLHRIEKLQEENSKLNKMVSSTKLELESTLQRTTALELLVNQATEAEENFLATEEALHMAQDKMATMTPRPIVRYLELHAVLGPQHADLTVHALKGLSRMQCGGSCDGLDALVESLTGSQQDDGSTSMPSTTSIPSSNIPAPTAESSISPTAGISSVLHTAESCDGVPNTTALLLQQEASKQQLAVATPSQQVNNTNTNTSFRGALHSIITPASLAPLLHRCTGSTASQYAAMEERLASLHSECSSLRSQLEVHIEAERRREAAKRRREEEAMLEKKNAVQQYLDLLSSQGEDAWKEHLIGMGQGGEVPKLFRHVGKIRNKHLSKRDTEKLVKEIWKERLTDPAVMAGRAGELIDFVGGYLQKKVGIAAAVIELGYNFLYGLWLYRWDADCELFLKIVAGEIREEVYVSQCRLQIDLEELFASLDKSKGQTTGKIPKDDLRIALSAFFRVGQFGGKTLARFDEAMQALDQDQPGVLIEWKKVFEEDREFNQGEFAESLRDQFLQERIEFFAALETALYEESGNNEECRRDHVIKAILMINPECCEKGAVVATSGVFLPGIDVMSIKAVMKKLSRGILRGAGTGTTGERLSEASPSALGGNGRKSSAGRIRSSQSTASSASSSPTTVSSGGKRQNEAIGRALEAVRQNWIKKQVESSIASSNTSSATQ